MAISVKVMRRPEPGRTSYMRATLKGMSLTFKHLVRLKKVTLEDPRTSLISTPAGRGTHRMEVHADGRPSAWPAGSVPPSARQTASAWWAARTTRATATRSSTRSTSSAASSAACARKSARWRRSHVGQHFENAEYTRDRFVYDLDRLMEQDHPTTLLWDPSDPRSE